MKPNVILRNKTILVENKKYFLIGIEFQQATSLQTEVPTFEEIVLKDVLSWQYYGNQKCLVPLGAVDGLKLYSEEVMCNHRNWHGMLGMQYFYTVVSNLLLFLT